MGSLKNPRKNPSLGKNQRTNKAALVKASGSKASLMVTLFYKFMNDITGGALQDVDPSVRHRYQGQSLPGIHIFNYIVCELLNIR